jgi:hypothetical protein
LKVEWLHRTLFPQGIYLCLSCCYLGIFGGNLLGVRSSSGLTFHDWETLGLIRRIEIVPKTVRLTSFLYHVSTLNIFHRSIGVKMVN